MSLATIRGVRYQCHKQVWALKIAKIEPVNPPFWNDGATITPTEPGHAPFHVDGGYCARHDPQVGGYYVVYDDGYESWSPGKTFESGYTRI